MTGSLYFISVSVTSMLPRDAGPPFSSILAGRTYHLTLTAPVATFNRRSGTPASRRSTSALIEEPLSFTVPDRPAIVPPVIVPSEAALMEPSSVPSMWTEVAVASLARLVPTISFGSERKPAVGVAPANPQPAAASAAKIRLA